MSQELWKDLESQREEHTVLSLEELRSWGRRKDQKTSDLNTTVSLSGYRGRGEAMAPGGA